MTGMMTNHISDDMAGLRKGLKNIRQYRQIVLMPSCRFLQPPEDPLSLIPLQTLRRTPYRGGPQASRSHGNKNTQGPH
jgi:hypothetical protein